MLRRRAKAETDPIAAFWSWWSGARGRVEEALTTGDYGSLIDEFQAHLGSIHPGLEWELGKGRLAAHALCVTPAGKGELRALSERWRLAGPAPDATWEFAAARPADPRAMQLTLKFDDTDLNLVETRLGISVDDGRQQVDVIVHHPRFPAMTDDAKKTVAYLVLDWLLGEDGVERWVGGVEASDVDPPASLPGDALQEVLAALQARHPDPTWALLEATGEDEQPIIIVARRPLKRVEHPLFDLHGGIDLPFTEQTPAGLATGPTLDRLRAFEDELAAVGGDGLLVAAQETHAGTRTIHLYCDSQGAGRSTVDQFLGRERWPGARVAWGLDPGWAATERFQ